MKRILTLFLLTFFSSISFGQTVYKDYLDGAIWFKFKNNSILYQEVALKNKAVPKATFDLSGQSNSIF